MQNYDGIILYVLYAEIRQKEIPQFRFFFLITKYCPLCCISLLVLCTVDLTKHEGVSLQLETVGSDPYCEMSINSKVEGKINVAAGTKASLSFLDCPNEDVRLTASKIIGEVFLFCMLMKSQNDCSFFFLLKNTFLMSTSIAVPYLKKYYLKL